MRGAIIIVYDTDEDPLPPEIQAAFGPNRVPADVIDFDRDDAFLLWRRRITDGDAEEEYNAIGIGAWKHLSHEQSIKVLLTALEELHSLPEPAPEPGS
jgi:hypothetical protein